MPHFNIFPDLIKLSAQEKDGAVCCECSLEVPLLERNCVHLYTWMHYDVCGSSYKQKKKVMHSFEMDTMGAALGECCRMSLGNRRERERVVAPLSH